MYVLCGKSLTLRRNGSQFSLALDKEVSKNGGDGKNKHEMQSGKKKEDKIEEEGRRPLLRERERESV